MKKVLLNYIISTLILTFIVKINIAQDFSNSGLNLGLKTGSSLLLGEIKNDLSGIINEFDNNIGITSSFEVSKYFSSRWEVGGEIDYSVLKGNAYSPEFSAEGFQWGIPSEITDPVEYKNKMLAFNILARYYFKDAYSESKINPFILIGAGYLNYNSIFKYIGDPKDKVIFGKGSEGSTVLSTPVVFIGIGIKIHMSGKFYINSSIDFNFVNYDFLDVMHNYTTDGIRLNVTGLYTSLKIGIFYNIHARGNKKKSQSKSKNGKISNSSNLPFSR